MNLSEFTFICLGMLFNVLTFVLGVSVGVSLVKRKDSDHDNRYESEGFQYHRHDSQGDARKLRHVHAAPPSVGP